MSSTSTVEPEKTSEQPKTDSKNEQGNKEIENASASPQWTLWTAASYAIVMLVIGLPLWWKTTTVQRVPLPYNEMLSLHQDFLDNLKIKLRIQFKGFSTEITNEDLAKFQGGNGYSLEYGYKNASPAELDVLYKSNDFREIDMKMCKSSGSNQADLTIFYVGRADFLKLMGHRIILGNCRNAYYVSNLSKIDMNIAWNVISKFVSNDGPSHGGSNSLAKIGRAANEGQNFQLALSAGYDILLSLLIPQPEILDCTWNIEKGVQDYIQPMLKKLSPFAEFTIRSQTLYYVKLNVVPKLNPKTGIYEVPYEQLPLVINPVESKLTSFVSPNPALNFLIYTAPCEEHPMQILDEDGIGLSSNAFLVPQWGGIQIYNAKCSKNTNKTNNEESSLKRHEIEMSQIMAVIISQFRSLLGLPEYESRQEIIDFHMSALRDWEVDIIVRNRLYNLMLTSANTIKSLGNLLDQITNIVVEKEVGLQVEKSVHSLKKAFELASQGDLKGAQEQAIVAFKASEIAFHHPTNLAQLYFPDDQKYAIYIPLFLPVGIPVLLSLRIIFQRLLGKNKKD